MIKEIKLVCSAKGRETESDCRGVVTGVISLDLMRITESEWAGDRRPTRCGHDYYEVIMVPIEGNSFGFPGRAPTRCNDSQGYAPREFYLNRIEELQREVAEYKRKVGILG